MLVLVPFFNGDSNLAIKMLDWCSELDGMQNHECLLVASHGMDDDKRSAVRLAARKAFNSVGMIIPVRADERGWPESANHLFRVAANHISKTRNQPWLWLEPDCTPLCAGWLDALESEYKSADKPYLGFRRDIPIPHLSGCAIYPAQVAMFNSDSLDSSRIPFDVKSGHLTLEHTHVTRLIHHDWGEKDKPPTFSDAESLNTISKEAVLFHRVKDGSLIDRLREQRNRTGENKSMFGKFKSAVTRVLHGHYCVAAYLPPPSFGHSDIFLKNLEEHPPSCHTILLSDHAYPKAVRIHDPTRWFKKSDQIASYVFLMAAREVKRQGFKQFIYLETDCRISGKSWDKALMSSMSNGQIAAGHLACCVPNRGDEQFKRKFSSALSNQWTKYNPVLVHGWDCGKPVPFVNGAPAVYDVEQLLALFPDEPAVEAQKMETQDREIGERMLLKYEPHHALEKFAHSPCILATAGETTHPFKQRMDWLNIGGVAVHPIKNRWRPAPRDGYSFYHSGDLGDIIYALKAIQLMGGGRLIIGSECRHKHAPRQKMTQEAYRALLPLLARLSYLNAIDFSEKHILTTYDFNGFRDLWHTPNKGQPSTLCEIQCYYAGVQPIFNPEPWLNAQSFQYARIVVNRSPRYHALDFPWKELVEKYRGEMLFVGLPEEHKQFCSEFGKLPLFVAGDFGQLAAVINGAEWFIGNQSFPASLAIGLGKKVLLEAWPKSPDCCLPNREDLWTQKNLPEKL